MTIPVSLTDAGFKDGRWSQTVAVNRVPIPDLTVVYDNMGTWLQNYSVERDGTVLHRGSSLTGMKAWIRMQDWSAPSPGPAEVCWEHQAGELPIRLSRSIKVF